MKRSIIKIIIWVFTFLLALFISGKKINKENVNLTEDMPVSTIPLITMELSGMKYNELHGYLTDMEVAYQRESVTQLGENRELSFKIQNYGVRIDSIFLQVRTVNGERLIENTPITDWQSDVGSMTLNVQLKDLIEKDTEYALTIKLVDAQGREIRYYTRVIWGNGLKAKEKLNFVKDFHNKTFNKESVKALSTYMESNSSGDNTTLHKVNIHSSLDQLSYGQLNVKQQGLEKYTLKDLTNQTASVAVDYIVMDDKEEYFCAREVYRIRLTSERAYLLSYDRTMWQIQNFEDEDFQGDKIGLGITQEDLPLVENEDGSYFGFVSYGSIYGYDLPNNYISCIFSYFEQPRSDERDFYKNYDIRILKVDKNDDIYFAVYGYRNRGLHEGEVGLQLAVYHKNSNTIEEMVYVPSTKSAEIVRDSLSKLLYFNENGKLFYYLDLGINMVDTKEGTHQRLVSLGEDANLVVSDMKQSIAWSEQNVLHVVDLEKEVHREIKAGTEERIFSLTYMGEDIIYGVAREDDRMIDKLGHSTYPMYKICICDSNGTTLKKYEPEGTYVVDFAVEGNQLSLSQVKKDNNGRYVETYPEQIVSNEPQSSAKNSVMVVPIDVYERFVQIKVKAEISKKTLQVLTPKWVVYGVEQPVETLPRVEDGNWYVYGDGFLRGIYQREADAICHAYSLSGYITDERGEIIWRKGNRVTKNQIMAIKERKCENGESSLSVCLDTMLKFEGISRDIPALIEEGKTAREILEGSLGEYKVLDLTGCPLDAVLYYTNKDIPVLAAVDKGECVLIVGFNEFNIVVMEPSTGKLYKKGIKDSTAWFEANGNRFLTYQK